MTPRRLVPVRSPITLAAITRGVRALPGGSATRRAEAEIGEWLERSFAPRRWQLVDSGTSALRLALQHAVHGRKVRRIALPAYGCYDLATACDGAEVEVVLYDLDPDTLGPDWASYEAALATGPAAVVLVHLYGVPVDLDRATALALSRGVRVIEDAAQGAGGSWQGKALGSFGDYAVLSFGRGKGITGGGGGALLLHTEAAQDPALPTLPAGQGGLKRLALALAQRELGRPWIYWLPASLPFLGLGDTPYLPAHPPTGMAPASLGLLAGNLAVTVSEAETRHRSAVHYHELILPVSEFGIPRIPAAAVAGYLRFPVVAPTAGVAARLVKSGARWGLAPGYPSSLQDLAGFTRGAAPAGSDMPGARLLAQRLVTLPTHSGPGPTDREAVAQLLRVLPADC